MQERRLRRLEAALRHQEPGPLPAVIRYVTDCSAPDGQRAALPLGPTRRVGRVVYANDRRPAEGVSVP